MIYYEKYFFTSSVYILIYSTLRTGFHFAYPLPHKCDWGPHGQHLEVVVQYSHLLVE